MRGERVAQKLAIPGPVHCALVAVDDQTQAFPQETLDRVQDPFASSATAHVNVAVTCDHCGAMITGERIKRKLKGGGVRIHDYYRCANNYPDSEHPSVRWRADDLEDAIVADLAKLRMPDDEVANWFRSSLQVAFSQIGDHQRNQRMALSKRRSELATMNDRLLNGFLAGSIDEPTFNAKLAALRDEAAQIEERLGNATTLEPPDVRAALAVFEFSQNVPDLWRGSKMDQKREILESLSLNRMLGDVTLVLKKRKPFDELAKRPLVTSSRGDKTAIELFMAGIRGWEGGTRRRIDEGMSTQN